MSDLTIFISHKMPKDSEAARRIGNLIASYSGNKIKIVLAEDFQKGRELTPEITAAIQSADIFLLLYTGEDQDWGYCLLEAGQFQTALSKDEKRSIVVFHDPSVSKPRALSQYISVPISSDQVYDFLEQIYVERDIYPGIDTAFLRKTATDICRWFDYTHVTAINFDLVPNFSIELSRTKQNEDCLELENLPADALFMGTQDWEALFGKDVSTGAWNWKDLSSDWVDRDIYEPELARMLRSASKKKAPLGCFIRPTGSDDLFRLTLRRYEEIDGASRLKFYFTAAPIDIPIFGIHDTTNKEELAVYNMINITWYARRKLIDQLYDELLGYVNSSQAEAVKVHNVVLKIRDELRSLEIQSNIRGISKPMDARGVAPLTKTMKDEVSWNDLLKTILECSRKEPIDIKTIAQSLYEIAKMNRDYYQLSAQKYADIAQNLQLPPAPP
ncbi:MULTISPECIES: toll/interleukin-1 receptor domain-containing protein [unclassified Bradyrhizobium]|uniref:toll/interleukin-1 receptor domain-containing protein n=1 Tax=unclassified Bradyrhizobium TaxID=2631580 RepID=UPI001FF6136D|nr:MULTISPECIES: toll/interleukin-1 receptor domain-containing protein [unclassified Bradyrhizobium]MCJ9703257.1 TIR domain-containing protein [Bradyrhizobium sp. SHOUNA76]MCJ9734713.1 TIR domain-containing protein [Bradyrhizobium sp. PRIMUS42]